jgi:hypothetical protein
MKIHLDHAGEACQFQEIQEEDSAPTVNAEIRVHYDAKLTPITVIRSTDPLSLASCLTEILPLVTTRNAKTFLGHAPGALVISRGYIKEGHPILAVCQVQYAPEAVNWRLADWSIIDGWPQMTGKAAPPSCP